MKKIIVSLAVAFTLLFTACSEDFDVAAPYKDISVVYGFLDMGDTAHYVRIQKAFIDQEKSAVTMAQNADSNFYSDINVRIDRYRVSKVGGINPYVDSIHLTRVDLTQEGYPKQPGTFFNSPNYAYKFNDVIDPKFVYRLKITHLSTGKIDSADATIVNNTIASFNVPVLDDINTNLAGMSFYRTTKGSNFAVDATYKPEIGFDFNGLTSPANIAQTIVRFNWEDSNIITKTKTSRFYDHDAGTQLFAGTQFEFKMENTSLYNALSTGMGKAPDNVIRLIDRCDITVYISTPDYNNYRQAMLVQGNGLTGSEIAPVYTNVKGENVLGLFTSRAMRTGKITITDRTVDSLVISPLLTHTNLKGTRY